MASSAFLVTQLSAALVSAGAGAHAPKPSPAVMEGSLPSDWLRCERSDECSLVYYGCAHVASANAAHKQAAAKRLYELGGDPRVLECSGWGNSSWKLACVDHRCAAVPEAKTTVASATGGCPKIYDVGVLPDELPRVARFWARTRFPKNEAWKVQVMRLCSGASPWLLVARSPYSNGLFAHIDHKSKRIIEQQPEEVAALRCPGGGSDITAINQNGELLVTFECRGAADGAGRSPSRHRHWTGTWTLRGFKNLHR